MTVPLPKRTPEPEQKHSLVDKLIVGYSGKFKDPRYLMTDGLFAYLGDKGDVYKAVAGSGKPSMTPTTKEDIDKRVKRMHLSVSDVLNMLEEEHKLIARTTVERRGEQKEAYIATLKARAIYDLQNSGRRYR